MQETHCLVEIVVDIVAAILTLAATIVACISAHQAKRAVQETKRGTQAQLLASLLDAYASKEMLDACVELERWKNEKGSRFAVEFRRLRTEEYDNVQVLDQSRRQVSHYFQKVYALYSSGLLDKNLVKVVASKQQVEFYREVIEPLEVALGPGYDPSSFDVLGQLYGISRQPGQASSSWPVR